MLASPGSTPNDPHDVRSGYKALTFTGCPPFQGGLSLLTSPLPLALPEVFLDPSLNECGSGWNYCALPSEALRISGLWPDGYPARLFATYATPDAIQRGENRRASSLTLHRELTASEIEALIAAMSQNTFGDLAPAMTEQQIAWRRALARPTHDPKAVALGLRQALLARRLPWHLRQFPSALAVWVAATQWDKTLLWTPRGATRASKAALDAYAALSAYYAALSGHTHESKDYLTLGLRDAYAAGLAAVVPTGTQEWGWAMTSP
jgi:hypothetical protein